MQKGRLEAFSDGVLAIIITIMVLNLNAPQRAPHLAGLKPVLAPFLCYVLSFIYVGIYWNNHHHMFQATHHVTGAILWANLHLLFWLSLVPFVTAWMGENQFAPAPVALYGVILLLAGLSYFILQQTIVHAPGASDLLAHAVGKDFKGKISLALYATGIAASLLNRWLAFAIYVLPAILWFIPDRRIERAMKNQKSEH